MNVLVDTNILVRSASPTDPQHRDAVDSVARLRLNGDALLLVPQVLYEYWAVAARPETANGLGRTTAEVTADLSNYKRLFAVLDESSTIFPEWEQLAANYSVVDKNAHDAHVVAAMVVHGVTHLLTFNANDFRRFAEITVLTPDEVLHQP